MNPVAANVRRVIDGDTIEITVRLRTSTSAPEIGTDDGLRAKNEMERRFPSGTHITVNLLTVDSYGRLLGIPKRGGL